MSKSTPRVIACVTAALALGVVSAGAGTVGDGPSQWSIRITMDKDRFLLAEPIWVDVEMTYTGSDTILLWDNPVCLGCGTFNVLVVSGADTFPYSASIPTVMAVAETVPPGKRFERSFELLEYYGVHLEGTHGFERELPPGDYTIQASEWGARSNELHFTIVRPQGHDAEIYEAMHQAVLLKVDRRRLEAASLLRSLLGGAPDSPYRDKMYFQIVLAMTPYREEYLRACSEIVEAIPDSRYARGAVSALMRTKTLEEARAYMRELEAKVPGTRAAKAAAEALEKGWIKRESPRRDE